MPIGFFFYQAKIILAVCCLLKIYIFSDRDETYAAGVLENDILKKKLQ